MGKKKIAVTLSEDIVTRLRVQAPGGNTSGFLEIILRKHFNLPVNSGKDDEMQDVIEHYREEKMVTVADAYEEGFESGKNLVLKKQISYKLIHILSEVKKDREKHSTLHYMNEWYEGIDNGELIDISDNYRIEAHESGDSDLYYKGFFDGIIDVWNDIESVVSG